jgi:nucleoside-diphosphate-sugar epimerase
MRNFLLYTIHYCTIILVLSTVQEIRKMKTICVLGAKGRLAKTVAKAFAAAGWNVIAVSRDGRVDGLGDNITGKKADAMNQPELVAACKGADVIFNGLNPPYPQWATSCLPMARNVIAAAKASGAVHLFPGNVYNYGNQIPLRCDEKTPFVGNTGKGKIRIKMEKMFEQAAQTGVKTIILRAGDFYGTAATGAWFDLIIANKVGKGKFTYPGPLDAVHGWAYLPDLAQSFVALADKAGDLPDFDQFNFAGHAVTGAQLKAACELASTTKLKVGKVPWLIIRLGGLLVPMWREISEVSYLWNRPHQLDGSRLETAIGRQATTNFADAVAQTLTEHGFIDAKPPVSTKQVDAGIASSNSVISRDIF